jgi:dTDP-4-dehydrorhamnose reductase
MSRDLIIGARGLVGSALAKRIPDALLGISVEPKEKNQVYTDVAKYETLLRVFSTYRPKTVYLAASIAHVDKCEDLGTSLVNVKGAIEILRLCESFESKLVYFSSSYVFDGEKKEPYSTLDVANPINSYGRQKLTVENMILKSKLPSLIIRTVGVYGEERQKKNFAKQVISTVFKGQKVICPNDQKMNPILSVDLAKITIKLAEKHTGLWHVAGDTCVTKFEFAKRIAGYFGLGSLVEGVSTEQMKQIAKRPLNGCLDCSELNRAGINIPSFDTGLTNFLGMEYN